MKKSFIWILLPILLCIVTLLLYFSIFNNKLSASNSDWGSFGDYLTGTVGIIISFLTLLLIYRTFHEQRKMVFEDTFQQLVTNYNNLVSLIHERWLHKESDKNNNPIYLDGREIFGRSVEYLGQEDQKNKFLEVFSIHINVFCHYFNNVLEVINTIKNNNEIKMTVKTSYYNRFSSNLSFFELVMLAYYMDAFIPDDHLRKILTENFINRLKDFKINDKVPHKEQVEYIIKQIFH
jgi:hypothetical protein